MNKVYCVLEESYDYFDYNNRSHGNKSKQFDNLADAWEYYKSRKSSDYNYGDSFHTTHTPIAIWCAEKHVHKEHGQRFGHQPTVEEKLCRAIDDAIMVWKEANDAYEEAHAEFCRLAKEEGLFVTETFDAEIHAQELHAIACDLWEKVEEAEAKRDAYWEYQGILREHFGYDPEDEDLFPELEECLPF